MAYLIDSDILIYYTNGVQRVHILLDQLVLDGVAISAITLMETQQGIGAGPYPAHAQARFNDLVSWVPVIAFAEPEARRWAQIRDVLHQQGKRVRQRALDLMIAATAIEHGLTLVTNNPGDYEDIPGIDLYIADIT